jgi:hypothetical protein
MAVAEEQHRASLEGEAAEARSRTERDLQQLSQQRSEAETELVELRQEMVTTREEALLQESGIYQYAHHLIDAVAHQAELATPQDRIKTMAQKDGGGAAVLRRAAR